MRYFKLMYDYERDDKYVNCDNGDIGNMNEYEVSEGCRIDRWDKVTFKYNSNEGDILSDYLANVYGWLVVSDAFRKLTHNIIQDQIQYLPIRLVESNTKREIDSFSVANVVKLVDALDLEKSKYDIFELGDRKIIDVEKYALKKEIIKDCHIFRLQDDTIPIFVSETLKKVIEENNLLGFAFLEVDVN